MSKRQTKPKGEAALAEKKRLIAERGEKIRELLARGPDQNYPVTKLSIEEQIALGIPLDTGWITTVRPPGSSRRKPKPKPKK